MCVGMICSVDRQNCCEGGWDGFPQVAPVGLCCLIQSGRLGHSSEG